MYVSQRGEAKSTGSVCCRSVGQSIIKISGCCDNLENKFDTFK